MSIATVPKSGVPKQGEEKGGEARYSDRED